MALMQYSVSPRRTLRSFGPNPSENVSTRTPMRRAMRKCPSSCTKIRTPSTKTKAKMLVITGLGARLYPTRRAPCETARPCVDGSPLGQRTDVRRMFAFVGLHRVGDQHGNAREGQPLIQECGHRDLVCGVQHDRQPFSTPQRSEGERQTGKPCDI